jgi:adenylate cyclase class 2
MKDIEIELKFEIRDLNVQSQIMDFLHTNATLLKETHQKDTYFSHKEFLEVLPPIKRLRVRESDKGNSINRKDRKVVDGVNQNYCDEYETSIGDTETVTKILTALDIKPLVVVDKKRKVYQYQDIEISLDEVKDLGTFIELEASGEFPSIAAARETLYHLAEEFGLQKDWQEQEGGYAYLFLKRDGIL